VSIRYPRRGKTVYSLSTLSLTSTDFDVLVLY
jgi:hypothetical protein